MYICMCLSVYTCYIFFIHLSINEHWSCFRILATPNNAAVNIVHTFLNECFLYSLDIYLRMGYFDHMVVLCLIFWGISILFFIVATPVYINTNTFLHILANICYFLPSDNGQSNQITNMKWYFLMVLICISLY